MTTRDGSFEFLLDGRPVEARPGETIWQVAKRHGESIPHLCFKDAPGYRPDGNCRACMVEIEGERTLAASCLREAQPGMVVRSASSTRAREAREVVLELLLADQPPREQAPDRSSHLWHTADTAGVSAAAARQAYGRRAGHRASRDATHPAMRVDLEACIHCTLCVRACREVQVNDVIGMASRGSRSKVVFDIDDPMGESTCVGCGECVQACPTGALMPASLLDAEGRGDSAVAERRVDSVCPYCGVGCQLTYHVAADRIVQVAGRDGPANRGRLCVKGRFGLDYLRHPARIARPHGRRAIQSGAVS
jgi:formate dehydrogenase major subunit